MSFFDRLQTGLTNIGKLSTEYWLNSFQMRQARRMGPYGMMALGGMNGLTGGSNLSRSIFGYGGYGNGAASIYGNGATSYGGDMSNFWASMNGASTSSSNQCLDYINYIGDWTQNRILGLQTSSSSSSSSSTSTSTSTSSSTTSNPTFANLPDDPTQLTPEQTAALFQYYQARQSQQT